MRANKFTFNIIHVFLLALLLIGCTGQEPAQPTPSASATLTSLLPTATYTLAATNIPLPTATLPPTIGPTLTPTKIFNNNVEKGDYLIYLLEHDNKLFFYDPATDVHIPILPDWEINTFAVSMNDQIAFSSTIGEQSDIYILDYPYWENSPINITNTEESSEYPHSWSPDGNYLLLHSTFEEDRILAVWDGNEFNQIHEFTEDTWFGYGYDWSQDGKFAFTVDFDGIGNDIYVWSGNPGDDVVNVSQNPSSAGIQPKWSPQGQLAIFSFIEDDYKITVWKELSIDNGVIHGSSFEIVTPDRLEYYTYPFWTNEDHLVFFIYNHGTFYKWDGQKVSSMDINGDHGYWGKWGPDRYWVSHIPFGRNFYVHNESNETILELEGYGSAWSPEGLLAFCVRDSSNYSYIFSIWNGFEVIRIVNHGFPRGKWRNGEHISCNQSG